MPTGARSDWDDRCFLGNVFVFQTGPLVYGMSSLGGGGGGGTLRGEKGSKVNSSGTVTEVHSYV